MSTVRTKNRKSNNKLSMILWITKNNKMSISQKRKRILRVLFLSMERLLFPRSYISLLVFSDKPSLQTLNKIFRRIKVLEKRGYSVRLKLSISGIAPWEFGQDQMKVLNQLKERAVQPIFDLRTLYMNSMTCLCRSRACCDHQAPQDKFSNSQDFS